MEVNEKQQVKLTEWLKNITEDSRAIALINESEERIIRAYKELLSGYKQDPSKILKATKEVNGEHEGLIIQKDINFYSICSHHFLPFIGKIHLAYEPGEIIIGLGKLKRLVDVYTRRFQIQEDLVKEIAKELISSGKVKGAYVFSKAKHLCICGRGPSDDTTQTITSYAYGSLKGVNQEKRILSLINDK